MADLQGRLGNLQRIVLLELSEQNLTELVNTCQREEEWPNSQGGAQQGLRLGVVEGSISINLEANAGLQMLQDLNAELLHDRIAVLKKVDTHGVGLSHAHLGVVLDQCHDALVHSNAQVGLGCIWAVGCLQQLHDNGAVGAGERVSLYNIRLLVLLENSLVQHLDETGDALRGAMRSTGFVKNSTPTQQMFLATRGSSSRLTNMASSRPGTTVSSSAEGTKSHRCPRSQATESRTIGEGSFSMGRKVESACEASGSSVSSLGPSRMEPALIRDRPGSQCLKPKARTTASRTSHSVLDTPVCMNGTTCWDTSGIDEQAGKDVPEQCRPCSMPPGA